MATDLALLGLLQDQNLHGYELKKRLTELLGPRASVSFGSLYPALGRLERNGEVEAVEADGAGAGAGSRVPMTGSLGAEVAAFRARRPRPARGRRNRKVYAITERGRLRLVELLTEPGGDERAFALRMAFCRHLGPAERLALFERRRAVLVDELARREAGDGTGLDRYQRARRQYETAGVRREIEWLDRLLDEERSTQATATTTEGITR